MKSRARDVQNAVLRVAVVASRGEAAATAKIASLVERMAREVASLVATADFSDLSAAKRQSLASRLIDQAEDVIDDHYKDIAEVSAKAASDMAAIQSVAMRDALQKATGDRVKLSGGSSRSRELSRDWIVLGADLDEWWSRAASETKHRVSTEIRMASQAGEEGNKIVARMVGEKVNGERKGGAFSFSRNDSRASSRTSHNAIANAAIRRIVGDNKALFRGVMAVATLDARTSKLCLGRHGSQWDRKGKPLPGSPRRERFPGPPPWHPHCRTILVPILVGEDAPKHMSADEWLEDVGEEVGREILGNTAYDLWADDKITTSQLLDQSGRPLTVEQLEDRFL